ncbi:MAG: hypothetical protein WBA45_08455 [Microthrixaceae bacterium]
MVKSLLVVAIAIVALAATSGCSGSADESLEWQDRDLIGNLVRIRLTDCKDSDCPLGHGTISDAEAARPDGTTVPIGDVEIAITKETRFFGCGSNDARVRVGYEDFIGGEDQNFAATSVVVWTAEEISGDSVQPVEALQINGGICG